MPDRPADARWTVLRTDALPDVTRELIEYEGAPHGFFNPQAADGRYFEPTLKETIAFLGTAR